MIGRAVIFYTTFFRHSYKIARAMRQELIFRGFEVELLRINKRLRIDPESYDLFGFITPVVGFFIAFVHPAGKMLRFIRNLRGVEGKMAFSLSIYSINPGRSREIMEEELKRAGFIPLFSRSHPATETSSDIDRFSSFIFSKYKEYKKEMDK